MVSPLAGPEDKERADNKCSWHDFFCPGSERPCLFCLPRLVLIYQVEQEQPQNEKDDQGGDGEPGRAGQLANGGQGEGSPERGELAEDRVDTKEFGARFRST